MPKPLSFGSIAVGLTTGAVGDTSRPQADVPFRIALLGDWAYTFALTFNRWFNAVRDTATYRFQGVYRMGNPKPVIS